MKTTLKYKHLGSVVLLFLVFLLVNACKKQSYTLTTTTDVNITGYLEKYPDKFSLMTQIVDRAGASGYLGAYGNYTLFTPTNDAINEWLKANNKTAVSELSVDEAKKMVNYHLILDTLNTKNFTDGKLQNLTQYGQYITSGVVNVAGVSTYILNKNSKIIQSNIRVGNGVLQVIDHVLLPKVKTLAQIIADNTRYSFFKQALVETGFYDSLNVDPAVSTNVLRKFQTVIAESDSALKAAGFLTYAQMKAKLSTKGNPKDHADSLWLYVAYHITPSANYLADVVSTSALVTLAPSEVITTKYLGQKVLLNEVDFNGKTEPGVELNRALSDVSASNGVVHDSKAYFKIKVRVPTALYWDMELDGLSQNPRHPQYQSGTVQLHANGASFSPSSYAINDYTKIGSQYNFTNPSNRYYNKTDMLSLSISGPTSNVARPLYHDFRTPLLVKGLYKVWICTASNGGSAGSNACQWVMNPGTANEQVLSNTFSPASNLGTSGISLSAANADNLMEAAGYKRYLAISTETAVNSAGVTIVGDVPATNTTPTGRLVGIANIRSTDRQWIRIRGLGGTSASNIVWLDMIHFIPVDQDQQYPRFSKSGTIFKRP